MLIFRSRFQVLAVLWTIFSALPAWCGAILKPSGAEAMPVFTRSLTARAEISGQFASTTIVMVFQNESRDQIEADFIYALPPGAVATYFAYWAGDEKVEAKIVEKKEAARIYKRLTSYVRDPALVEFAGKNTFRARISPIFPDQDLKVEIRYVQVLPSNYDSVGYTVSIGPADAKQSDPLESVDVAVRVKGDSCIRSVLNNYGVPIAKESDGYVVSIKEIDYRPPKDLTVRVFRVQRPLRAEVRVERPSNGACYFSLALTPNHSLKHPKISFAGISVSDLTPTRLPDVRAGRAVVVNGRLKTPRQATVRLSGQSSSGRRTYLVPVDFNARSPLGIASKLWAAAKIADLDNRRSNRKAVISLSFAHSLPSRYTSWLAMPTAEKKWLELEKIEPKLWSMAEKMAEMIANGQKDSAEYRALETEYTALWKPLGQGEPRQLTSKLYEILSNIVQKIVELNLSEKPDPVTEAALRTKAERIHTEIRLLDPNFHGALEEIIASHKTWLLESRCRDIAGRLVRLIIENKSSNGESANLRTQLAKLQKLLPAESHAKENLVAAYADDAIQRLAWEIVSERHKPKPNKHTIAKYQTQMTRLATLANANPNELIAKQEKNWLRNARYYEAEAYAIAVEQGNLKEAQVHLQRYSALKSTADDGRDQDDLKLALKYRFEAVAHEYCYARKDPSTKPTDLKRLRDKANRLAKLAGESLEDAVRENDLYQANERMYDAAEALNTEISREHPIRSRVDRFRKETEIVASEIRRLDKEKYSSKLADAYNATADTAISAWPEEQKAKAQARAGIVGQEELNKAAEKRKKALEELTAALYYIKSSVRGGDPLISVNAPGDALCVVALLPDGSVKTLLWNEANRRWEARFDVPTGTPDGDYVVTVVVILADGTRKLTTISYKVDNTPPSGTGSALICGDANNLLRLEVKPNEEIARAVALLPWGERIELRRHSDSETYRASVPVPPGAPEGKVEFVLTDNAHNRASIVVNPEAE